ncbi:acyltransferase [Marvinbryantia formatexigens DSM 14469]|uniref:Acyltransferase n=1 Tax=Marvinbryantia formatexigens DSM 14469 TaxID=478749 RepID=C6LAT8_9FIRM|nr:acyltransferase [Marvinbryantia formatexigens]EET62069.1 acyltransferase [Marvinbryantia formatexigens DSM 14469]UWO26565.1 acyltransferase [Marvinbryantia formatexigens DSM 14469]SDH13779.1 Peptidoglycan/LPS O-acetylase OafA/YrhL, contains acyltransferase and SGNH-hydrolase domains [Marvinbryantia formatexigens]
MNRENNFGIIRIIAAWFVFAGHLGLILGGTAPRFGGFSLHELGVFTLFLISGYLITMSWLSDPHPLRFAIRRFFRLWPPLAVMVLLVVFVAGPLLSDLGVKGYFESWYTVYLRNLRFFPVFALPGVFTDVPIPNTVNGSLWTMPVEAALYVITPILLTILRVKHGSKISFRIMAVFTILVCGINVVFMTVGVQNQVVVYGVNLFQAYQVTVCYVIGILFTYEEVRKYLNIQLACVAMCVLLAFQSASGTLQYILLYLIFPYFIFSFVFAPKPVFKNVGKKVEPSYGIYLYGFFFQQLVVSLQLRHGISLGYTKTFLLSALFTLAAAVVSCYLVEKPMQRVSHFLIKKVKRENTEPK